MNIIRNIVIVGGGTAGWMTAAALSNVLNRQYQIRLVESDEIATIGVGEATIPHIRNFNAMLGLDENEFMRRTQGTFKLGIEFVNWRRPGDSYIHGFGKIGRDGLSPPFHHHWLKMHAMGAAPSLDQFSINTLAPRQAKFIRPVADMPGSPLADIAYAFHFDATLYARFLRDYAEARGVVRTEGKITHATLQATNGHIDAVVLDRGERIEGDLFIDCSGIRGLLIEDALGTGFEDWSSWLPCDRAIPLQCESVEPLIPMTRSTAHSAGWQWRIPLQHRIGNGHVYSSAFMRDEEALRILSGHLDGAPLGEPRVIRYLPGRRKRTWSRNCVAIGLSAGFLEPLESTSIHLIQMTIMRLLSYFPDADFDQANVDAFNRDCEWDYQNIRDFLILHYKATERDDSAFWNYCRNMEIPDSLKRKMALFAGTGRVFRENNELFAEQSWVQVMIGQGIAPRTYDPLVDVTPPDEVAKLVRNVQETIRKCVEVMPTHAEYIARHCAAGTAPGIK